MKRKTDTLEDYREYPYDLEVEKKFLKHKKVGFPLILRGKIKV